MTRRIGRMLATTVVTMALSAAADNDRPACPATMPPQPPFVPPAPYPPNPPHGAFYFGTPKLWTMLYDGPWHDLPRWDIGYRQKIVWWTDAYDGYADLQPALSITGTRLDAPAAPLVADAHANRSHDVYMGWFIMSGVNFPATGCWEITGRYRGAELKFVVRVDK